MQVLYEPIAYQSLETYANKLQQLPDFVWLDSARFHPEMGRYSYMAVEPFAKFNAYEHELHWQGQRYTSQNALEFLSQILESFSLTPIEGLPPLQGGVIGYFSYELNRQLEQSKLQHIHHTDWPLIALGFYDVILAFDHSTQQAWAISTGFPEISIDQRRHRAYQRLHQMLSYLDHQAIQITESVKVRVSDIKSNFNPQSYKQAVQQARHYILEGDIFEVNLSQRFTCHKPTQMDPFDLYCQLRVTNPAPFAAYIHLGERTIVSASPERFLKVNNGRIQTRPIKGTAPRSHDPKEDLANAKALEKSEKDWAENIMIVDLLRNDLSKVCKAGTIEVPQLCSLESFETVHHLVSVVEGELSPSNGPVELLRASFPGGSITGAPKVRAMEIINEIEATPRGPYCGSIGFIGFNGVMDTSIVIRTIAIKNDQLTFHAGGAIVLDSDPTQEYEETLTKARALIQTLSEDKHGAHY